MWTGVLYALLAGALWGMVFVVPHLLSAFSPLELTVGRYIAYGAMALSLMFPRLPSLARRLGPADYAVLVRHALAGNIGYYMLLALGVQYAGVAPTSLIVGLLPLVITLMGHKEPDAVPLRQLALPMAAAGVGIACINVDVFLQAADSGLPLWMTLTGIACAVGALLSWAWYGVDNARYLKRNPRFTSAEWSALYGLSTGSISLVLGVFAFAIWHGDITGAAGAASGRRWPLFWAFNALLALGASVVANLLWNAASRRVPVTLSGQLVLFGTLFALLYGFALRPEPPRALELAAIVLLVAGVAWSIRVHMVREREQR